MASTGARPFRTGPSGPGRATLTSPAFRLHLSGQRPPPAPEDLMETADTTGNIEQIRDTIFGAHMRDYDRRFAQLEERLLKDSPDLRDELRNRYSSLEEFIRREIESLSERIAGEQGGRAAQVAEVAGALEQLGRTADRRFGELGEDLSRQTRDLRGEAARQGASFAEELQRRVYELNAALKREADELHTRKADRAALGALFADLAQRLADEFRKPDGT